MSPNRHLLTRAGTAKFAIISIAAILSAATSLGSALAHSYPQTMDPAPNARLDSAPAHVGITHDSNIVQSGTSLVVLDSTDTPVATGHNFRPTFFGAPGD
jgi:methionine-rich copper-binding protein CopC